MRTRTLLLTGALLATSFPLVLAQEVTASGSLQTEASWSALRSMIEKTSGDLQIMRTDLTAIRTCNAKGMLYAPASSNADGNGCTSIGSKRLRLIGATAINFSVKSSSNSAVSQRYAIPEDATKVVIDATCAAKNADAELSGRILFNVSGPYSDYQACSIAGVNDSQTNMFGIETTLDIPPGATEMTIIRQSSGPDVKRFTAAGFFLGQ